MKRLPLILFLTACLSLLFFLWPRAGITNSGQASVEWLTGGKAPQGFAQVYEPKPLVFPADLGSHEDYQTEWWYYTGNLETNEGRKFGYQLTFFRRGLTPPLSTDPSNSVEEVSAWRSNQVYFSHFTLSDISNNKFYPHERFSRNSIDLSGAQASPYRVWVENWSAEEIEPGKVHLVANADDVDLDLVLTQTLPPQPQAYQGYSPKGPEPGNASYYYSIVQQQTKGTVSVLGESIAVTGVSWKDHEYSTSSLNADTVGWDWFSLQFDNGAALMLYGLRRADGTFTDLSNGNFITADGTNQTLDGAQWQVEVLDTWHSPTSQSNYPSQWHLEIPSLDLVLDGKPLMANQELNVSTTYWEGAVQFTGKLGNTPMGAKGYIELAGYANSLSDVM